MSARVSAHLAVVLLVGLFGVLYFGGSAAALPNGFADAKVADIPKPTALDFTPDGRMLVTAKDGQLRIHKDGTLLPDPALDLADPNGDGDQADSNVCFNSERGLLGVAVDPDFRDPGRKYVYLYYTHKTSSTCPVEDPSSSKNPVNRVSRFTMSGNTLGSEKVLIDNILSPNGNHNGGDLKFGKNKLLYVSVGDGGCDYDQPTSCAGSNDASRDRNVLLGKVLRIRRDGGIPTTNPYTGQNSARCNLTGRTAEGNNCKETFAVGLRNPFRMAFDPDATGTSFRINDVGQGTWEEIDRGEAGADYGWNLCEGSYEVPYVEDDPVNCPNTYTAPIHEYNHDSGCSSITGGAFVPDGFWPASYNRSYLYGDFVCNKIFKLTPRSGGGFTKALFTDELGGSGPISMDFGPYGASGRALYYTTFDRGGQVRRIVNTASNREPVADARTVGENFGPMAMDFDGSGSRDPDGDTPLTYVWDFGDGSAPVETTNPVTDHSYGEAGKFTASLTVRDGLGKESAPDKINVYPGNTPPRPEIESPSVETVFRVGQEFTATGSATDAEDGSDGDPTTAPELSWEVRRYHNGDHYHTWASGTGGSVEFTAPAPEDLYATNPRKNYLQVRLTAKDSLGLSRTVTRRLEPKTVNLRFESAPLDFELMLNGSVFRAPKVLVSWKGYALNVEVRRQLDGSGRTWAFERWSDGRARAHVIRTPGVPTTYTAYLRRI